MNKIKLILICSIAIVATCAFCIGLVAMNEQVTTVKLSETCTIDIIGEYETVFEHGLNRLKIYDKFHNNKSTIIYSGANAGTEEILIFGMLKMMFVGDTYDTGANPLKTKMDGEEAYVIYTGNNITHDNILIISKNRDECIKMYKSIKYDTKQAKNTTTTTNKVTKELEKQAVGYKSDGTPMYSQAEVNNYVQSKYGCVDYHLQDNGYVALDDPHYTSDGYKINSSR